MSKLYSGYETYEVTEEVINSLHAGEKIEPWDERIAYYPHLYLELKSNTNPKNTALAKVCSCGKLIKKIESSTTHDITPRNREQVFALDALNDDSIPIVVITGRAGGGKTLLSLATSMQKIQDKKYKKTILTRPMSQVGREKLGSLPGSVEEKYMPFLLNYLTNLEQFGGGKAGVQYLFEQGKFEVVPLQLIRGASFSNCFILADEVQILDYHEMLTIGSRVGENSKLVIMGDLNQRDEKIAKNKTGIYKLINDIKAKESPLIAVVDLVKCERSKTARFFSDMFEEK